MVIYKITNTRDNKVYIGQTIHHPKYRWSAHCANRKCKITSVINKAITLYGKDVFTFEVIDNAKTIEELNEKEIYWISFFNSYHAGYNRDEGGKNRRLTMEHKIKISLAGKGKKRSKEWIEKLRQVHLGSKRSLESKSRMSESAKKRGSTHLSTVRKLVRIIDDNGVVYPSISEAARILDLTRNSIHEVLKGNWKQVKGRRFKYYD